MSEINNFLFKNWTVVVWFVAAVFAAGGIYSEFASLKNEVVVLEERLGKKIENTKKDIYKEKKRVTKNSYPFFIIHHKQHNQDPLLWLQYHLLKPILF